MKVCFAIIMSLSLFGTVGLAQPTVTQISNAASASLSVPAPHGIGNDGGWNILPNSAIAQGSYFTVYGNGFGGAAAIWNPYPLPTELGGTSVSIAIGSNLPVAAYIEFAAQFTSYSQINAVLPSTTPVGAGTLTVTYNGQTSAAVPINVVASSFGDFALNEAGSGPGIITHANYAQVTPFNTAKPGEALIMWGTGLGPAPDPSTEATAPPCPNTCDLRGANLSVTVWVGNQQANLYYAGRSQYTGEDEIIFYVPNNVTAGCYVSVAVQTGPPGGTQITSNFTTLAVNANGSTCQDADGVNMNDIAAVVGSKGSANVAAIGLLSNNYYVNYGGGDFSPWDEDTFNAQIGTFDTASLELFQGFTSMPSVNSCTAFAYLGSPPPVDYGLGYVTYLDAGPSLSIQGPTGTRTIDKNSNGHGYEAIVGGAADPITAFQNGLTPFYWNSAANGDGSFSITGIASGTYSVTGPGGTAVNGFTGTIDVSSAAASFVWTNASTFDNQTATPAISRSSPLDITWTGGDPQGFVDITLTGSTLEQTNPSTANPEPAVYVQCVVPASKMSFSVPTYVLQALPPGENGVPASGFVAVGPASAVTKISPAPTGLDAAYLYYRFVTGYTVQWQ